MTSVAAANMSNKTNASNNTTATTTTPGVAGRTNYAQWDKLTKDLVTETDAQEEQEKLDEASKLGHDKYARSQAEADEKTKAQDVQKVKAKLESYQTRERALMQTFVGLVGPLKSDLSVPHSHHDGSQRSTTQRITRSKMDAGKRVLTICDTCGHGRDQSTIVLTQDLSLLESQMGSQATALTFAQDAQNDRPDLTTPRTIYGVIKIFVSNVHHACLRVKCKLIAGVMEIHNCSHLHVIIEESATVATIQADLSQHIQLEFRDAPSGKNVAPLGTTKGKLYWGADPDDRIFHAGVADLHVMVVRDDVVETEIHSDYLADGAATIGNATAKEMQFVTSVHDNHKLVTEKVVRVGASTGKNVRAMTQRELNVVHAKKEKAAHMAVQMADVMIQIQDKEGNIVPPNVTKNDDHVVVVEEEEVHAPATDQEVRECVAECDENKQRGNEAFGTGEYGQAILLYSLAIDKAAELPDPSLYPLDVCYSNRAACFLKLGQHEKAQADAELATTINDQNVKAHFRLGLAYHAMGRYELAIPALGTASQLEPHNKQITQALQFAEVRMQQEQRQRMEG